MKICYNRKQIDLILKSIQINLDDFLIKKSNKNKK